MGHGEGVGGCTDCIKRLFIAINFLFWLTGGGLVGMGTWGRVSKSFKELAQNQGLEMISNSATAVIVIGGVIVAVGFFGFCGARNKNRCLLVTFFICLFPLFGALVGAGTWVLVSRDTFIQHTGDVLYKAAKSYYHGSASPGKVLLDFVQSVLECCGGRSFTDYFPNGIPSTCPSLFSDAALRNIVQGTVGCADKLGFVLENHTTIISGITLAVGAIMLFGMILSMLQCCSAAP